MRRAVLPVVLCLAGLMGGPVGTAAAVGPVASLPSVPTALSTPDSAQEDDSTQGDDSPLVVAHRGGAAYAPENTMLAVEHAHRHGVDAIEIDVMFSADDELVIFHDDTLERTTDCTGGVDEHTVAELQRCDAAYWWSPGQSPTAPDEELDHPLRGTGVTIPTLREFLTWAASLDEVPELAIEAKSIPGERNFEPVGRAIAEEIVALVQEFDLVDDAIVFAFWPTVLDHVQLLDPQLRTLFLTTSEAGILASKGLTYAALRGYDAVGPNHDAPDVDERYVALAAALDKPVYTYTVNEVTDQQRVIDLGVHGIITDWHACTLRLLDRPVRGPVLPPEALAAGARPIRACPS